MTSASFRRRHRPLSSMSGDLLSIWGVVTEARLSNLRESTISCNYQCFCQKYERKQNISKRLISAPWSCQCPDRPWRARSLSVVSSNPVQLLISPVNKSLEHISPRSVSCLFPTPLIRIDQGSISPTLLASNQGSFCTYHCWCFLWQQNSTKLRQSMALSTKAKICCKVSAQMLMK